MTTIRGERRFTRAEKIQIRIMTVFGWGFIGTLNRTLRFETRGAEVFEGFRKAGQPLILSFWHNQILYGTYCFRGQDIVVLTSRNFDGEYIARIIEKYGYVACRGSSSRGAVRALLQLRGELKRGRDVAFSIDGPRGPRYRVKGGPLLLSAKAEAPILPFHLEPKSYWELNSWDGFRIPKPFTRVVVQFGRPLWADERSYAEQLRGYQEEMERIQGLAEEYWRSR